MLNKLTPEAEVFLSRLEDKANIVLRRHIEQVTEFVDPYLRKCGFQFLRKFSDLNFACFGGVHDAERQRIVICPEFLEPEESMAQVCLVKFKGKLQHIDYSHRDFLGALLGQGIKREKVGDLFIIEEGFVAVLSNDIADFLLFEPLKIKGVPLTAEILENQGWEPPIQPEKIINTTVSSLRLDTVVAHGFGISRAKVTDFIKGSKVKVNWQVIEDIDYHCAENDIISFRGKGRIKIKTIGGKTNKGRLKITFSRYE
jgi:RNA-binding protein YlmH